MEEGENGFSIKVSRGWFEKFNHQSGIHSVATHGEAASSNKEAAEKYFGEFRDFVNAAYLPQHVFNIDATSLFFLKFPSIKKKNPCLDTNPRRIGSLF